jgi:hypothetical protein
MGFTVKSAGNTYNERSKTFLTEPLYTGERNYRAARRNRRMVANRQQNIIVRPNLFSRYFSK